MRRHCLKAAHRYTRSALSSGTRPAVSSGFCVVTPVGHALLLHLSAWMQPSANIIARAALQVSAPSASVRTTPKPVRILPAATTRTRSRSPAPRSTPCTSASPSSMGAPTELLNSGGAAPVPPSAPSTVMKSGVMSSSTMARTIAQNSSGWPTHSLMPTGLPPDSSRRRCRKSTRPRGPAKALWRSGDRQSRPIATPRASAMAGDTLAAGRMPPCAGLAPWLSLSSTIFTAGGATVSTKRCGLNAPASVRHPTAAAECTAQVRVLPHAREQASTRDIHCEGTNNNQIQCSGRANRKCVSSMRWRRARRCAPRQCRRRARGGSG